MIYLEHLFLYTTIVSFNCVQPFNVQLKLYAPIIFSLMMFIYYLNK